MIEPIVFPSCNYQKKKKKKTRKNRGVEVRVARTTNRKFEGARYIVRCVIRWMIVVIFPIYRLKIIRDMIVNDICYSYLDILSFFNANCLVEL